MHRNVHELAVDCAEPVSKAAISFDENGSSPNESILGEGDADGPFPGVSGLITKLQTSILNVHTHELHSRTHKSEMDPREVR
jgi:hypothetical protein